MSQTRTPPTPAVPTAYHQYRSMLAMMSWGAALGAVAIWLTHGGLIDDSYITLSYAQNLATAGHWGLTPQMISNSATSPLNVIALAAVMRVVLISGSAHPVISLGILTVLASSAGGWFAARTAQRLRISSLWAAAALAVVVLNPFVLSALGLEVVLIATCLLGLLSTAVRGQVKTFGVLAALAVLTRLDLIVVVLVLAICAPGIRRRMPLAVGIGVLCAAPWFITSWLLLGSAIPDTFIIKTSQRSFGDHTYLNGLWTHYWPMNSWATATMFISAGLSLLVWLVLAVAWLARRRRVGSGALLGMGLGALAYFGVYSVLGVPPYQWYYVAPVAAVSLAGIFGLGVLLRGSNRLKVALPVLLTSSAIAAVFFSAAGSLAPWSTPPVFGNFATAGQYQQIGSEVAALVGDGRVGAPGEIGTLAFSCQCEIVDAFSDRSATNSLIAARLDASGPVMGMALKVNYAHLRAVQAQPLDYQLLWMPADAPVPAELSVMRSWPVTGGGWVGAGKVLLTEV